MSENKIKALKTFFRVSTAAFEFQNSIQLAFSGHIVANEMQQLHKMALVEIEKENPNLLIIDSLLAEMEDVANKINPKPNYPKGGISFDNINKKGSPNK